MMQVSKNYIKKIIRYDFSTSVDKHHSGHTGRPEYKVLMIQAFNATV